MHTRVVNERARVCTEKVIFSDERILVECAVSFIYVFLQCAQPFALENSFRSHVFINGTAQWIRGIGAWVRRPRFRSINCTAMRDLVHVHASGCTVASQNPLFNYIEGGGM